jgi:hypothetical protein
MVVDSRRLILVGLAVATPGTVEVYSTLPPEDVTVFVTTKSRLFSLPK